MPVKVANIAVLTTRADAPAGLTFVTITAGHWSKVSTLNHN